MNLNISGKSVGMPLVQAGAVARVAAFFSSYLPKLAFSDIAEPMERGTLMPPVSAPKSR